MYNYTDLFISQFHGMKGQNIGSKLMRVGCWWIGKNITDRCYTGEGESHIIRESQRGKGGSLRFAKTAPQGVWTAPYVKTNRNLTPCGSHILFDISISLQIKLSLWGWNKVNVFVINLPAYLFYDGFLGQKQLQVAQGCGLGVCISPVFSQADDVALLTRVSWAQ